MSETLTLRPLRRADGPDGPSDLDAVRELRNADMRVVHGSHDYDSSAEEIRIAWTDDEDARQRGVIAEDGGRVLGFAAVVVPLDAGAASVSLNVRVRADARRRGIGGLLLAAAEQIAADEGRSVLQCWTEHPPADLAREPAISGWGSVPRDATTMFARDQGYALEQVYRKSRFTIDAQSLAEVERLAGPARAAAGDAYVYEWWETPTPPENADDIAELHARMSTDAPSAGVEEDASDWDAARVARWEEMSRTSGYRKIIGAARHVASGRLVAFNELSARGEETTAHQNDTLVLREHRGHRLGMLVKCETLLRLHDLFPAITRIETYNAEENRPMLDINEEMGFAPLQYSGMWQKRVASDGSGFVSARVGSEVVGPEA